MADGSGSFDIVFGDDEGNLYELSDLDYYEFREFAEWAEQEGVDFDVEYLPG